MNIPAQYKWVLNIPNQPKMIVEALQLTGIKEFPGKSSNNPVIMGMAADLHIPASIYPNDETAWCAVAHNWLCLKTGKPLSYLNAKKDIYELLRADSFRYWGIPVTVPMFGDTMVFDRPGGKHVGLYIAEDIMAYHILGGNQGNAYGFTRMAKDRLIVARRFYSIAAPASVRVYTVAPDGVLSQNEA